MGTFQRRQFVGVFDEVGVILCDLNMPSIGSKGSFSQDFTTQIPIKLGDLVLCSAITTATSIDDLLIIPTIVSDNTIRITAQNPTGGAVDPDLVEMKVVVLRTSIVDEDLRDGV